jgi:hypothetical protein
MRPAGRVGLGAATLTVVLLAAAGAGAGNGSSNTSSNCSNGRCTRVETRVVEDRHGRRGHGRLELWSEGPRQRSVSPGPGWPREWDRRRERAEDDDDD